MKIIALQDNNYISGDLIAERDKTLIVEMTQEEYQKCCAILYKKELEK